MATMTLLQTLVGGKDAGWYSGEARKRRSYLRFTQDVQDRWKRKYRRDPGSENDEAAYHANVPTLEAIRSSDPDLVAQVYKRGKDGQFSPRTGKRVIGRYSTREELGWDPLDASWKPEADGGDRPGEVDTGEADGAPPPITTKRPPPISHGDPAGTAPDTDRWRNPGGQRQPGPAANGSGTAPDTDRWRNPGGQRQPGPAANGSGTGDLAALFASLIAAISDRQQTVTTSGVLERASRYVPPAAPGPEPGVNATSGRPREQMRQERRVLRALAGRSGLRRASAPIGLGGGG